MFEKLRKLFTRWANRGESLAIRPYALDQEISDDEAVRAIESVPTHFAQLTREVLNADGMSLTAYVGGQSNVGIGISGTWVGTVSFFGSIDGLIFFPLSATPFASGTAVSTTTANGNWFSAVKNLIAVKVTFSRTSGSVQVNIAGAVDSSWQDAFLSQAAIFNSSQVSGGVNTLTQAAQANRAWNLTFCEVSILAGSYPGSKVDIYDGTTAGTKLFTEYLTAAVGSVGTVQKLNLPDGGIVNTPGNAMTIVVTGITGANIINSKFSAA